MTVLQGLILGLVQGLGEFLPISSSGHLAVAQHLLGLQDVPLLYDVILHLATLGAVVFFFRKKIWLLLCAFGRLCARRPEPQVQGLTAEQSLAREKTLRRYILAVVLSTLVTGAIGIVTEKLIGDMGIKYVCAGFLCTAALLVVTATVEKVRVRGAASGGSAAGTLMAECNGKSGAEPPKTSATPKESVPFGTAPTWWQALIIGFAQGVGTLPGISRSGSTIAGSLLCGVDRGTAGEYSFIVSIPAILGAFILELRHLNQMESSVGVLPVLAGCVAAFVSGYAALALFMRLVRGGKLQWFACYLIPVGILGIIFL